MKEINCRLQLHIKCFTAASKLVASTCFCVVMLKPDIFHNR